MRTYKSVELAQIKPYGRNNKKHDKNIERIADSIKRNEYISPIIVDESNVILAGHGRKLALDKLGIKEIEVLQISGLTDKQKADFRIADNRTTELSEWDYDAVLKEIEEFGLEELKIDFPDLDFDAVDLDEEVEDEVPNMDNVKIIVEKGDIFQLGDHRLMCGDATSIEDVEKLMDGKKADMVFTDPPYGIDFESNSGAKIKNDDLNYDELQHFNSMFQGIAFDVTRDDCFMMVWQSPRVLHLLEYFGQRTFFRLINMYKSNRISFPHGMRINKTEPCVIFKKGSPKISDEKYIDDTIVYVHDKETHNDSNVGHPTPKPVPMICDNIVGCIKEGELVLDLFLGGGSTLIASEKTNRICYGTEIDPKYIQVILKRYHDYTKGQRDIKCLNRDLDLTPILNGEVTSKAEENGS